MKGLNKILLSVFSIFVFSILILNSIDAVSVHQMIAPINNTNHTGTVTLLSCNVTMGGATNVTFRGQPSGGAVQIIGTNVSNNTAPDTSFNVSSVSITGLTDASTYSVWCTVYNNTAGQQENSTVVAGITFDSTNPTCSATVPDATISSSEYQDLTYSITDALSLVNFSSRLTATGSVESGNYTDATASPRKIYSAGNVGSWSFQADGIDRAGNTCTASVTWTTSSLSAGSSGGGGGGRTTTTPDTTGDGEGVVSSIGSSISNFFSSIGNWFAGWFD